MTEAPTRVGRATGEARRHAEGPVARMIEEHTAMLPSDVWLWAGLGSVGASLAARLMGKPQTSLFIGQWVAPLLIFGIYNKLVKVAGPDRVHAS